MGWRYEDEMDFGGGGDRQTSFIGWGPVASSAYVLVKNHIFKPKITGMDIAVLARRVGLHV